ncbi:hypothetical protein [Streptomyces kanamyceticus]|uniref:Uncharacterized protein n=1 Tax=Streptomyces kanamyceticus TaxID=1967 RepID=A0A5J6GL84_STRKN|nr:hypothetical protein [Streptomyces kanamyceticus]QEU94578.1 hypothetical protein CP970_30085 [Streptomyces kanamyceticus]
MSAQPKAPQSKKSSTEGMLALFGFILIAQGFGSAITESGWDTSFGVSALLREANAPAWTDLLVGALGCVLLALAARRRFTREAP